MALADALIHTCVIKRPIQAVDRYNKPTTSGLADHLSGVACRLLTDTQHAPSGDEAEGLIISLHRLIVPANVDVQEGDVITAITTPDGTVIDDEYSVEVVLHRWGAVPSTTSRWS